MKTTAQHPSVLLALCVLGFVPTSGRAEVDLHPAGKPVRVMSFNIRYGTAADGENHWDKRKDLLATTILTFEPDLLGTQETLASQRDFLVKKLPGFEAFGVGRDDGKDRGEMAALFYRTARFEKLAGGHFWLSETPDNVGSKGWDAALPRIATWVRLNDKSSPKARPILYINTHFDHRGNKARTEAAKLIRSQLSKLGDGCRLVITGDFNADEGSEPYQALFGQDAPVLDTLRAYLPTRGKVEGTFTGFKPTATTGERIDWIGCSRDWEVRLAGIDRTIKDERVPSDHFPVTAVLRPRVVGSEPTLRVLSYNIHHGEGTDGKVDLLRLAKVIRAADPDFVALQEVDNKTKRTSGVDQTAELARLTGLHGVFGKAIDFQGGEYGQAILARYPLRDSKVHTLPGEPDREQRIAFEGTVTFDAKPLTFVTTHLHHQSDDFRLRQARKINELFATAKQPIILTGDLNAPPASKPLKELAGQWTLAVAAQPLLTFPAEKPTKQIDFILYRPSERFRVDTLNVLDESVASDHRPIFAILVMKGK